MPRVDLWNSRVRLAAEGAAELSGLSTPPWAGAVSFKSDWWATRSHTKMFPALDDVRAHWDHAGIEPPRVERSGSRINPQRRHKLNKRVPLR